MPATPDLSGEALSILSLYAPDTYCISLEHSTTREELQLAGFIEWVPGPAWAGQSTYAITDAGRQFMRARVG